MNNKHILLLLLHFIIKNNRTHSYVILDDMYKQCNFYVSLLLNFTQTHTHANGFISSVANYGKIKI